MFWVWSMTCKMSSWSYLLWMSHGKSLLVVKSVIEKWNQKENMKWLMWLPIKHLPRDITYKGIYSASEWRDMLSSSTNVGVFALKWALTCIIISYKLFYFWTLVKATRPIICVLFDPKTLTLHTNDDKKHINGEIWKNYKIQSSKLRVYLMVWVWSFIAI